MTDPRRLADEGDLGATLLASARGDAPTTRARERARAALGLAVGTAAVTSATTAGAGGTTAAVGKAAAAGLWLKIGAGAALVVGVAGGAAVALRTSATVLPATAPAATVVAGTGSATRHNDPLELAPSAAGPVPSAELGRTEASTPKEEAALLAASTQAPRVVRRVAAASASAPAESTLFKELHALDEARSALDRGDATGAIAHLDRYDRGFPHGALHNEADVLRAEALLARGDAAAAKSLARTLLARDPAGPHARRLQSIASGP